MADTEIFTITDEILQQAAEDIKSILKDKKLSYRDRKIFDVLSYFVVFLMTDHKKIVQIEKRSWGLWVATHQRLAIIYGLVLILLGNLWFVAGFRRPIVHAIIKNAFGVDLPLDLIP